MYVQTFCGHTGWFVWDMFGNFISISRDAANYENHYPMSSTRVSATDQSALFRCHFEVTQKSRYDQRSNKKLYG